MLHAAAERGPSTFGLPAMGWRSLDRKMRPLMGKVFTSLDEAAGAFGPSAVSIRNFDGVHLGHRTLVRQTQRIARAHGSATGVLRFIRIPPQLLRQSGLRG